MSEKKSIFTVSRVLRVLALLCIVFVFCPSFLVSCSGETLKISAMTAVKGLSAYGETVVKPHPVMLLGLFIPAAVFVLLFIKKLADRNLAGIIAGCMAVDLVIWLMFRSTVMKLAEENYCIAKTTFWFVLNVIVMLLMIASAVLVAIRVWQMDTDLAEAASGGGTQAALNQISDTVKQVSGTVTQIAGNVAENMGNKTQKEPAIGYCSKCGTPITYGNKFCITCGTPVPEDMIAEAEAARKAAEEAEAARKAAEEAEAARKAAEEAETARKAAEEAEAARKAAEEAEAARKAVEEAEAERIVEEQAAAATASPEVGNAVSQEAQVGLTSVQTQEEQNLEVVSQEPAFCQKCGAELGADAKFCIACGAKVE